MNTDDDIKLAYDDAMGASNELGYACMSAGDVIRYQAGMIAGFQAQLAERDALLRDVVAGMNGQLAFEEDEDVLDHLGMRAASILGVSNWGNGHDTDTAQF